MVPSMSEEDQKGSALRHPPCRHDRDEARRQLGGEQGANR
jgi:hypothetical protein